MDNYIVSARKYRPITFDSVVGQASLTTTLRNAILTGKLANAYLFCGPRGVGKTTCARLFAKAINCQNLSPSGEACGECESCQSFNEEMRSYNVFELDAASNNSVEDIRALTEQVRIPPASGKYKVYIIDEVHMLSTAAFNAFLKTLEEPPKYAVFILATTEKHKIIPTILSRCQTYDFNRIGNQDIAAHLKSVADKEGIETEPEALDIIAEKADGGMRDALSIFDQVSSFTQGHVTYQRTIENLNVLDFDYYFRMTDHILKADIPQCMLLFNDILNKGFDGSHFMSGMLLHFRNLLVSHDACTLPLLETSDSMRARYAEQSQRCQPKFLYKAMKLCTECDLNYRTSKNKRLLVELTIIRTAQVAENPDDPSCGLGPKKLNPIFSKIAAGLTGGQQPAIANRQPVQTPVKAPVQTPVQTPVQAPAQTVKESAPQPKVVSASRLFASIRRTGQSQQTQTAHKTATTESSSRQVMPLEQERLAYFWKEFATSLPAEDSPLINRMLNITPKQVSDNEFVVTALNSMAANEIEGYKERILEYIQVKFNNSHINFTIKIDDSVQITRILSKQEMYDQMKEANKSLALLESAFDLRLS